MIYYPETAENQEELFEEELEEISKNYVKNQREIKAEKNILPIYAGIFLISTLKIGYIIGKTITSKYDLFQDENSLIATSLAGLAALVTGTLFYRSRKKIKQINQEQDELYEILNS